MENIFNNIWIERLIWVVIIIIVSLVVYKLVTNVIIKNIENKKFKILNGKKSKTYIKLTKSISRYVFLTCTVLLILQVLGINISSVIAGVGVLGVVFGLAIQDWLKDIIRGSSILSDNYFVVGDVVKYKGMEGTVQILGLKTTKIQDLKTGNIVSIANRNIDEIEVVSNLVHVKIPFPYELPLKKAEEIVMEIVNLVKENSNVIDCRYKGVADLADSSINHLLQVECNPLNKFQIERDTKKCILEIFEKNNISVPYNQIDVHQK